MSDQRHKRGHPTGQRYPLTPKFKRDMAAALERLDSDPSEPAWHGRAQVELAHRLGQAIGRVVDKSTIGKILRVQTTSALVPWISRILSIPMPSIPSGPDDEADPVIDEMIGIIRSMGADERLALMIMLRRKTR